MAGPRGMYKPPASSTTTRSTSGPRRRPDEIHGLQRRAARYVPRQLQRQPSPASTLLGILNNDGRSTSRSSSKATELIITAMDISICWPTSTEAIGEHQGASAPPDRLRQPRRASDRPLRPGLMTTRPATARWRWRHRRCRREASYAAPAGSPASSGRADGDAQNETPHTRDHAQASRRQRRHQTTSTSSHRRVNRGAPSMWAENLNIGEKEMRRNARRPCSRRPTVNDRSR